MATPAKFVVFVFVILVLGLWIYDTHPYIASASAPSVSLVPLEPGVVASKTSVLPAFKETGVLMYDLASGAPGVPYLVYVNTKGELMTRQLIFSNSACSATAGDLPCLYSPSPNPDIPAGTVLDVTGGDDAQGVYADSYQTAVMPSNMVVFTATLNQPVTLSNGSSVTLLGIADDASCTLGEGCFGDGTVRAAVRLSMGSGASTEEMVPGSLHEFGPITFVPLALTGTGTNIRLTMLAVRAK